MSNTTTTYSGGISVPSLLGIVFIILKLCNVIDWSWWWVTAPFWLPATVILIVLAGICLVPLVVAGVYMLTACVVGLFNKLSK